MKNKKSAAGKPRSTRSVQNLFNELANLEEPLHICLVEGDETEREISIVAMHDEEVYPNGWVRDAPLCQFGECAECKAQLVSWAKEVICPLCGAKSYCT